MQRNSSLFYIVVTLVATVGDTNQDITTEQEATQKLIEECFDDLLDLLQTKGLVML